MERIRMEYARKGAKVRWNAANMVLKKKEEQNVKNATNENYDII